MRFAIRSLAISLFFASLSFSAEHQSVPEFAIGRLSIGKMGTFFEQTAAYANQVSANSGPLAKQSLAYVLLKVPFDQSLEFDGPAVIYLLEPLNPGPSQETASILPLKDAAALKRNLAGVYGDPEEKNGASWFLIPQPLPQPDKTLILKTVGNKALLAPSEETLKQLELAAVANVDNSKDFAELALSVTAFKKLFGKQVDAALQLGAMRAAENGDAFKKVSGQLDAIQKTLWDLDTINLRLDYSKDAKQAALEVSVTPKKGTPAADFLSRARSGLTGRNATLLPATAPIHAALMIDSKAIGDLLENSKLVPAGDVAQARAALAFLNGENLIGVNLNPFSFLAISNLAGVEEKDKKAASFYQQVLDIAVAEVDDKHTTPNSLFSVETETLNENGAAVFVSKPKPKQPGLENLAGTIIKLAHSSANGAVLFSLGSDPVTPVASGLARAKANAPAPVIQAIFGAPPEGTLGLLSLKSVELLHLGAKDVLPPDITPDQLTGGLEDEPVAISLFVRDGRGGINGTLPAATAGSLVRMYWRLRRANIDIFVVLSELMKSSATKLPAAKDNDTAPPPPLPK